MYFFFKLLIQECKFDICSQDSFKPNAATSHVTVLLRFFQVDIFIGINLTEKLWSEDSEIGKSPKALIGAHFGFK
tara:strand:+ start:259 stop:483 length:225 start_codon:yes stop_codon:yes gene_type:complete